MGQRTEKSVVDGYDVPLFRINRYLPPVSARKIWCKSLNRPNTFAEFVLGRNVGRCDVRCRLPFLVRGSMGTAHHTAAEYAEHFIPNVVRASNAVGYKNYPDNVIEMFVSESAKLGIDVFRIFDSSNWLEGIIRGD